MKSCNLIIILYIFVCYIFTVRAEALPSFTTDSISLTKNTLIETEAEFDFFKISVGESVKFRIIKPVVSEIGERVVIPEGSWLIGNLSSKQQSIINNKTKKNNIKLYFLVTPTGDIFPINLNLIFQENSFSLGTVPIVGGVVSTVNKIPMPVKLQKNKTQKSTGESQEIAVEFDKNNSLPVTLKNGITIVNYKKDEIYSDNLNSDNSSLKLKFELTEPIFLTKPDI